MTYISMNVMIFGCKHGVVEHHVEVKGTTGSGAAILLTKNEVDHARLVYPNISLFIVYDIRLQSDTDDSPLASGGRTRVIDPLQIDACELIALNYQCRLASEHNGPGDSTDESSGC
jgi:hypothetical protein